MQAKLHTMLCRFLVLCVALMISQTVCAESPDYPNSCGSGHTAFIGGTRNYGYIDPGDVDVFEIVIPYDGSLNVFSMSTSPMDPKGVLKNAGCFTVGEHWDGGGIYGLDFDITYPSVKAGEVYYLEVSHQGGAAGQGSYIVYVMVDAPVVSNHTIAASAGSGGSISPSGSVSVTDGGSQSFTITPDACYETADVVVDSVSQGAIGSYVFANVDSDHTIAANFASAGSFAITADAGMGGSVSPGGTLGYPCGVSITYSIIPETGNEILDVVVDGVSQGPISSYSFNNITSAHTISATFTPIADYTITTTAGSGGSISPVGPVSVSPGGSETFTITPDAGYEVDEVWVDGTTQGAITSYTFSGVNADHTIEAQFTVSTSPAPAECVELSDAPLDSAFQAAPANIMFVLDDSGSMDFEVMTPETDTEFGGKRYVFDDPGDNYYSSFYRIVGEQRKKWKSQWTGYNKMYYDPQATYNPWPTMGPADTRTPRSHPAYATWTFDLADEYLALRDGSQVILDDGQAGFETEGEWMVPSTTEITATSGDWRQSTLVHEDKKAFWRPNLVPDVYEIWVNWVADEANHSDDVFYQVYGDGAHKDFEVKVDQRYNGGVLQLIGTAAFETDGYVRLLLDDSEADDKSASADSVKFIPVGPALSITNAHYYTWHDVDHDGEIDNGETVYLVYFKDLNSDGILDVRVWYEFDDANSDDIVIKSELNFVWETSVPEEVRPRSFAEDLQNFANWYSYYRRRELTAIGAIASVITQVQGMNIGFYSIHERIKQPVLPVHVEGVDETDTLLNILYTQYNSGGHTPLRTALLNVGRYFHQDDGQTGNLGAAPFADAANGGECQQCFTIMMTDGAYNGDAPWDPAQDHDGDDGAPYADGFSNTLADVAMYYYENDLSAALSNQVPTNARDNASHQHMVTYGIGFGINGSLIQDDYDIPAGVYPTWPDPSGAEPEKVDDMWHATVNGRGKFLSASNAVDLVNDFLLILKDIELYSSSASSVAVNGDDMYSEINNETRLYQSKYYNQNWHGDVLSFKVDNITGEPILPAVWSAADMLSKKTAANRLIATYDGTSSGKKFLFSRLTHAQRTLLDPNWTTDGTLANEIVDYLRGSSDNEQDQGGNFRNRRWAIEDPKHPNNGDIIVSSKLGDIIHSSPVFRDGVLYSGANDGMLHAFDAGTGEELFAYVPNLVFHNLVHLTDPDYTHKYFVDLTPTVRDLEISGNDTTMLVGGLGKGGKGYYALDVTGLDPRTSSIPADEGDVADMVMWEYPRLTTPEDEAKDMGFSFSKPEIVGSNDSSYPFIVIFGNGYKSENGHAVLFILDPASGTLIKRIDTDADACNGLSTPTPIDVNADDKVDYIYAGDLKGNMWKFDLTSDDYNDWDVAFYQAGVKTPLFRADNQPITTRPDVMRHCAGEGYMVFFGTGKHLGDSDITSTDVQSVYGIWDYGDDVDNLEYVGSFSGADITNPNLPASVNLRNQSFVFEDSVDGVEVRVLSRNKPDWKVSTTDGSTCGDNPGTTECDPNGAGDNPDPLRHAGWYIDLTGTGERVVSDVIVRDGKLIVISFSPQGSKCGTGGSSWVMQVDACSGGRLSSGQFDRNNDGTIDEQDLVDIDPTATLDMAVATGVKFSGRLQPPAICRLNPKQEKMYMSSSRGDIETVLQRSAKLGVVYWRIFREE